MFPKENDMADKNDVVLDLCLKLLLVHMTWLEIGFSIG